MSAIPPRPLIDAALNYGAPESYEQPHAIGLEQRIRRVAQEIATGILNIEDILVTHGIDPDFFATFKEKQFFKDMVLVAKMEWDAAVNSNKRVALKSAVVVEDAMVYINRAIYDERHPLSSRIELLKWLTKNAGIGNAIESKNGTGAVFRVEINLGADKQLVVERTIEHQEDEIVPDAPEDGPASAFADIIKDKSMSVNYEF